MLKNPSPQVIALLCAITIAGTMSFFIFIADYIGVFVFPTKWQIIWMLVLFAMTYFIVFSFVVKYIYTKIKIIYKNIHSIKGEAKESLDALDSRNNLFEDVEKKVADWAAQHTQEQEVLKALENYRRTFIGDVSHELKTPIFNIQGYIETLLEGGLEDETINRLYLEKAARNVDRLQTITEDLSAIARLDSGQSFLDIQTFDIQELTQEVFDEMAKKAKAKNITLQFKEDQVEPFKVKADPEMIRQVLTNLLNNSIKYGNKNGTTKVSYHDMDKNILVEVADTGIGIAPEHLNHVFNRFYRVDKSRSREQGGSGLGLAIVKHIIEAHHQTLNVRSTLGKGSIFGFTLEKL
jgi:two-component system, OmpR family, phosphate regulon sensor histidine kinase PhoR